MNIGGVFLVLLLSVMLDPCLRSQTTPPWSHSANNPAAEQGYQFQVEDVDNVPDLHGNPEDARLVLFIGGNQFFVLPKLIAGFQKLHPELRGHIFYETLPPGIMRKQMASNNTLTLGNFTLHVEPDVYEAGAGVLEEMAREKLIENAVPYATNDLAIMVAASNPKNIHSLNDLSRLDVRVAMPNPQWEGVASQIGDSLRKAGGEALFHSVYETKVQNGATYLTQIHHRQTPMRILRGDADAGVTWASEVRFQMMIGNSIAGIEIPRDQNTTGAYAAGVLRNAPHQAAARAWVAYLTTPEAQAIYREYGFGPAK
jgi:accessory colonization factor AcfC